MSASTKVKHRSPPKKIFLVDDHPMMRQGVAQLIAEEKDLSVCGEAEDAADALNQIEKLKPDLALVDITLRSTSGLELIKDVGIRAPSTAVLLPPPPTAGEARAPHTRVRRSGRSPGRRGNGNKLAFTDVRTL